MLEYDERYSASLFRRLALCAVNAPRAGVLPRQHNGRIWRPTGAIPPSKGRRMYVFALTDGTGSGYLWSH